MNVETLESYQILDHRLKKALKISLGLHIAVFLFFTVKVYLIPDDLIDYESSLRVDIVALPQKDLQKMIESSPPPPPEPESATPEARAKPEPKKQAAPKEDVVILNPKKKPKNEKVDKVQIEKKQKEALNRLKQMSALENLENQMKNDTKPAAKPVFAGNQIATGSDLRGLSKIQHDSYVAQVERHIRQNWALPQWLANKKLRAQIRVKIDSNGLVISKTVVRSSGNSSFDDVALETIEKSSPVPRPPDKLAGLLTNEGILFGFPD